jgi:hypothetical protein
MDMLGQLPPLDILGKHCFVIYYMINRKLYDRRNRVVSRPGRLGRNGISWDDNDIVVSIGTAHRRLSIAPQRYLPSGKCLLVYPTYYVIGNDKLVSQFPTAISKPRWQGYTAHIIKHVDYSVTGESKSEEVVGCNILVVIGRAGEFLALQLCWNVSKYIIPVDMRQLTGVQYIFLVLPATADLDIGDKP